MTCSKSAVNERQGCNENTVLQMSNSNSEVITNSYTTNTCFLVPTDCV